jgi:AcrR family transcriptional regulator
MPPKVKIQKSDILQTALALVREQGANAINARAIAAALGCSTQPVFSNFATMEELHQAVAEKAQLLYQEYTDREMASQEHPAYKASGMAYIRFAKEERELFKLLFMRDRTGAEISVSPDFEESVHMIMEANGVTRETASRMHLEVWTCVHGIGTMLATSFLSLTWELISDMLTDVYQGIRARHASEETINECHKD